MTNAGDAAEEIVKISLEGTEMALRLTGAAAKNIAVALYAIANDQTKKSTRGKHWLKSELKSGTDMSVFMLRESDTKKFVSAAKQYGLSYCVIKDEKTADDGMIAVFVRSADASRASHIIDRFELSQVKPETTIQSDDPEKDEFIKALGLTDEVKAETADKSDESALPSEEAAEVEPVYENPSEARTVRSRSEPSSETDKVDSAVEAAVSDPKSGGNASENVRRRSVRKKLAEIKERMTIDKAAKVTKDIVTPTILDVSKTTKTK